MIQDSETERRARRATGGSFSPDERLDATLEANDAYQAACDAAAEDDNERELGEAGA